MFDKADVTRDGTISIAEYMALCQEYGIVLTEEDIKTVEELADSDGEVIFLVRKKEKELSCLGAQSRFHSSYKAIKYVERVRARESGV